MQFAVAVAVLLAIVQIWSIQGEDTGVDTNALFNSFGTSCITTQMEGLVELVGIPAIQVGCTVMLILGLNKFREAFQDESRQSGRTGVRQHIRVAPSTPGSTRYQTRRDVSQTVGRTVGRKVDNPRLAAVLKDASARSSTTELTLMEESAGGLTIADYSAAISKLGKDADPAIAHRWLRRAIAAGCIPGRVAFGAVVNSYAQRGDVKQALDVVKEMEQVGLDPDTVIYNMIIGAWGRAGDAAAAQLWMDKMQQAGLRPSVVSFGTVFKVCAEAGLVEDLDHWFAKARELCIHLNLVCFGAVVKALSSQEQVAHAMTWITRMIEYGVQPDIQCFMWVLKPILKKGNLDEAASLIECMRGANVQPDAGIFGQCIVAACNVGNRRRALDWAEECIASKCKLSNAVENVMVQARLRIPKAKKYKPMDKEQTACLDNVSTEDDSNSSASSEHVHQQAQDVGTGWTSLQSIEEQIQEERMACVGRRFMGVIKYVIPERYGFIQCDETYSVFRRDVFLCRDDYPELVAAGQRVSFILRTDYRGGHPRASDVRAEPCLERDGRAIE